MFHVKHPKFHAHHPPVTPIAPHDINQSGRLRLTTIRPSATWHLTSEASEWTLDCALTVSLEIARSCAVGNQRPDSDHCIVLRVDYYVDEEDI